MDFRLKYSQVQSRIKLNLKTGFSSVHRAQFWPTHYVDITATEGKKRAACFAHTSQDPDDFYQYHDAMNRFRGMEAGRKYAEAFVRHVQSPDDSLPVAT